MYYDPPGQSPRKLSWSSLVYMSAKCQKALFIHSFTTRWRSRGGGVRDIPSKIEIWVAALENSSGVYYTMWNIIKRHIKKSKFSQLFPKFCWLKGGGCGRVTLLNSPLAINTLCFCLFQIIKNSNLFAHVKYIWLIYPFIFLDDERMLEPKTVSRAGEVN